MKKNVAILAGGYCNEAAVRAAACVEQYLSKNLYNPFVIVITENGWKYKDCEINKSDFSIIFEGKKISFDVIYNCVHGKIGEDGCLSGYFDILEIPYTGCESVTSAITFNKSYCNSVVKSMGIVEVAKSITINEKTEFSNEMIKTLKFPLIVKPATSGGSFGVSKVNIEDEIFPAIEKAFEESSQVLIEQFIKGRELTCGVYKIHGKLFALPITEIISEKGFFDNEDKHNPTKAQTTKFTPAEISENLTKQIQNAASIIFEKLNCASVVRFDFILEEDTDKIFFLEVNTIPGFWNAQSFLMQQVLNSGVNLTDFFGMLIADAIARKNQQKIDDSLFGIEDGIMEKIGRTAKIIQKEIVRTPCSISEYYSNLFGMKVFLKKENQQITGSFKARGALAVLKNLYETNYTKGIVAASTGNHALALAYHCMKMDMPLTIVVPICTSKLIKSLGKSYGANIIKYGYGFKEAREHAMEIARDCGKKYIDTDDNPFVIYGQSTVSLEILEDVSDIDAIIVPSGGGLLAGTLFAVKNINPNIKVIGVKADCHEPNKNEPFTLPSNFIAVHINGSTIHDIIKDRVDDLLSIDSDLVAITMIELFEHEHIMVEAPAVLGLAALRSGKLDYLKGKKVAVVLTGGNIDKKRFEIAKNRSLFLKETLTVLEINVSNKNCELNQLFQTISSLNINIRDVSYRNEQSLRLVLELKDRVHNFELQYFLSQKYKHFHIHFPKKELSLL